jgi:hypothetical protein
VKYRCINAFATGDRIYTGGEEVDEGDQILKTHRGHFAEVTSRPGVFEAATAEEGTGQEGAREEGRAEGGARQVREQDGRR